MELLGGAVQLFTFWAKSLDLSCLILHIMFSPWQRRIHYLHLYHILRVWPREQPHILLYVHAKPYTLITNRPYVVTLLHQIAIFEWYMARLVVMKGHQKDTCYNDIGLCAQVVDTIKVQLLVQSGGPM